MMEVLRQLVAMERVEEGDLLGWANCDVLVDVQDCRLAKMGLIEMG